MPRTLTVVVLAMTLSACGTALTPVQFTSSAPAKDVLDAATRALAIEGQSVAARDDSTGTLETVWQETKYPGWGGKGRLVRRYRVIASPGATTAIVVRADAMSCPDGIVRVGPTVVMTSCGEQPAVPEDVQTELASLAAKVRAAVAK